MERSSLPLVSIITPSYNQALYLEHTLVSVLGQNYPNLEYFVIDGGSQDGSQNIIQAHASQLAGWVSEPDRGQADAINKGFRQAKGEIVAWLNSDDLYLPGAISQAVEVMLRRPEVGLVFGNALTIDAKGHPLNLLTFGDWGLLELMRFRIICQPAVFMRRNVLLQAGLLDESYHLMLDHHLWLRMARHAGLVYVPALWAAARQHPSAKNAAQAAGFSRETKRLLAWLETNPEYQVLFQQDRRAIQGGALRLSARYLLDSGAFAQALGEYMRAMRKAPAYTLHHWHRMVYALLSMVGLGGLSRWYYRLGSAPDLSGYPQLNNWPGLALPSFEEQHSPAGQV
jgi:glycosyltransferase involved in cell wall biosynthesis